MASRARQIKRILGIDFETANRTRSSACSLGICHIDCETGNVIEKKQFLINPNCEFDYFNTLINGITPTMVKDSPCFADVLPEIANRIDKNTIVVTHNASFDISVLRHSCEACGVSVPDMEFYCTYIMAKSLLPGMVSYSLPFVAERCGLESFHHHLADDDAEACARIFLYFLHLCDTSAFYHLPRRSGIACGYLIDGRYHNCHKIKEPQINLPEDDTEETIAPDPCACEDNPFNGKVVVFTGALSGMPRSEAEQIVQNAGGLIGSGVTKKTNYIICGYQDPVALKGKAKSRKMVKAEKLAADGQDIQILNENEFFKMI